MGIFRVFNEILGKKTHGNPVTLPSSSAIVLKNFECVRDNVYRKPRGREEFATGLPAQDVKQFLEYKGYPFLHLGNNTIYKDDGTGAYSIVNLESGGSTVVQPDTSNLIQHLEISSNLYFTSSSGIMKLDSLTGTLKKAGVPRAIGFDARIINNINWLPTGQIVSYRVLFTRLDANNNLIIGAPSERVDVENASGGDRAVELRIYIPAEITTAYKLEIYRSSYVATGSVPPEDFQLVYQAAPTSAEITAGVMTVNDILPDDFKGSLLYTNTTQEGIQQANDRPPLAISLDKYKDYVFYANTQNLQRLYTSMVGTTNLTPGTSTITVNNGTLSETWGCMRYDTDIGSGVSATANNGAGLIRITTTDPHGLATNEYVRIYGVGGTVEANGCWLVTYIAANQFDLQGSAYVNAWTAGGTIDNVLSRGNNIASMADNGGGKVRATTTNIHGLATGDYIRANTATGTTAVNGVHMVTFVSTTAFDLLDVTFVGNGTANIDLYEDIGTTPRFFKHTWGTDAQNIENTAKSFVKCFNQSVDNTLWYGYYISGVTDPPGKLQFEARALGATAYYFTVNSAATGSCFSPAIPTAGTTYVSTNDVIGNGLMFSKANQPEHVPTANIYYIGNKGDPILKVVGLRDSLFIIKQNDGIYRLTGTSPSNFIITAFDETLTCLQRNSIARGENSIFMFSNLGYVKLGDTGVEIIGRDNEFKDLAVTESTNFEQDGYGWYYKTEKSYFCSTHALGTSTTNDIVHVYNTYTQAWHDRQHGVYTGDTNIRCARVIDGFMYTAPITGSIVLIERKDYLTTDFRTPDIAITIATIVPATNHITITAPITIGIEDEIVQGAQRKKIVSIISTTEFELDNVNNLVAAAATVQRGIVSTILYQNCTCGSPDIEKEFREINIFFDNDETEVTNIDLGTYSDLISPADATTTHFVPVSADGWGDGEWGEIWGSDTATDKIRKYIPSEESRAAALYVEIIHKIPNEQCALCGYSVVFDEITERTKR